MIRDLTIFTCTLAIIASMSPCSAHSRPGLEFRRASTGEIYFQPTPPLEAEEGELWVDSRNGNQFYFLNGAWTFEDMGTAIASAQSEQTIKMAAGEISTIVVSRKDTSKNAQHDATTANHNHRQSNVTALHEPEPLGTIDVSKMKVVTNNNRSANGVAATAVTQATFGSDENATENQSTGLDNHKPNSAAKAKSNGPHMSLTDALNADELVDLLRSIGAAH